MSLIADDKAELRKFLTSHFSFEELKTLAFDLGVDYDVFHQITKPLFSAELINYEYSNVLWGMR